MVANFDSFRSTSLLYRLFLQEILIEEGLFFVLGLFGCYCFIGFYC